MQVTIENVSETAKELLRLNFNPSGNETVAKIKLLAGALMTAYEDIGDETEGYVEADTAIMFLQTASMWGVLAATKGLK